MIGPTQTVEWSEAIIAFQTFYHNLIIKQKTVMESLEIMKTSSGFGHFEAITDKRLYLTTKITTA